MRGSWLLLASWSTGCGPYVDPFHPASSHTGSTYVQIIDGFCRGDWSPQALKGWLAPDAHEAHGDLRFGASPYWFDSGVSTTVYTAQADYQVIWWMNPMRLHANVPTIHVMPASPTLAYPRFVTTFPLSAETQAPVEGPMSERLHHHLWSCDGHSVEVVLHVERDASDEDGRITQLTIVRRR